MSVSPSVRTKQLGSYRMDFMKFDICVFFENLWIKFTLYQNLTTITVTLHADRYTFVIISRSVLLKWEMFHTKVVQKIKTHILCSVTFSRKSCRLWDNVVQRGRPQMAIWRMRSSCWIPNATDTHSEYVIFITFPLQQWLQECIWLLRDSTLAYCLTKAVHYALYVRCAVPCATAAQHQM